MSNLIQAIRMSALTFSSLAASASVGLLLTYVGVMDDLSSSSFNEIFYVISHPLFVGFRILTSVSVEAISGLIFLIITQVVQIGLGFLVSYLIIIPLKIDFRIRNLLISACILVNSVTIPYQIIVANCQPGGAFYQDPNCEIGSGYPSIYSFIYYVAVWAVVYGYTLIIKGLCYKCLIMRKLLNNEENSL